MARRRTTRRRRYYARARRSYRRAKKSLVPGGAQNAMFGFGAGFLSNLIPSNLPIVGKFAKPAVLGAGAIFLKKPVLMACAAYEAGKMLSGGSLSGSGNGFYE